MNYAFAGGVVVGVTQQNESLLERITRKLRAGWKGLKDFFTQPGNP